MSTITATVTNAVTQTVTVSAANATSSNRATPQGGVFEGVNPAVYDPKNPLILFIIQASIVIIFVRIIHFPLAKLRQPRVIAEVLTGIILGPSIMGRIPGFTSTIFPSTSMPAFSLVANIGLMLFLFLVGLEVDLRYLLSNWKIALSVGALGMLLPFGLGCGIAWGLYNQFKNDEGTAPIGFGTFMLFIGVAMAITAFPVLCRILTSLKLLHTNVGVIVLSAGVGNDVVGWILLALCVALVNSGAGLTALYILLVSVAYCVFIVYAIRPAFVWVLRRTGSLQNGPTQSVVALTILLVFASSFFTAMIGIHAIFGAFIIGLICPHEGGFAIKLTEKIEDLVSVLFLPLYFALSGLSTNLGLLNDGITWAYVIGICAIAFFGKIIGGTLASRFNGLVWRESMTIGVLMSCKGLVELIVLNIGLQARILSPRTFTMFVVMALVTTLATTPLTMYLYPPWYQQKLELWRQGKIDWDGNRLQPESDQTSEASQDEKHFNVARKILVYLRLDGMSGLFTVMSLLGQNRSDVSASTNNNLPPASDASDKSKGVVAMVRKPPHRTVQVHGLRLMELTERESSVMKVSEIEEYASRDPIIKAFGTFGQTRDVSVMGQIAVVPDHSFSGTLAGRARELDSDLIVVPWSETGTMSEHPSMFDNTVADPLSNRQFTSFAMETFEKARSVAGVAFLVDKTIIAASRQAENLTNDRGDSSRALSRTMTGISFSDERHSRGVQFKLAESSHCPMIVIYRGNQDDLFALKLALQLASTDAVQLTVLNSTNTSKTTQSKDGIDTTNNAGTVSEAGTDVQEDDFEFDALRLNLPPTLKPRVTFKDCAQTQSLMEVLFDTLKSQDLPASETIVVVGRSAQALSQKRSMRTVADSKAVDVSIHPHTHQQHHHHHQASSSSNTYNRDETSIKTRQSLGPLATNILSFVRDQGVDISLVVVQARVKASTEETTVGLQRKRSSGAISDGDD